MSAVEQPAPAVTHANDRPAPLSRLLVYGLTILASAFLLFLVQPMVGKALLPRLGGVPGAWTACLLFFQAALLLGYGYVWIGARLLSSRVRILLHIALIAVPAVVLTPMSLAEPSTSPADQPALYALAFLAINVGVPFTVLSATSPLLSSWFAESTDRRPYFLYAASNAGSLGALIAYPFLVEPHLDLEAQAAAFRVGFIAVAIGIGVAGVVAFRKVSAERTVRRKAEPITWRRRLGWVALSFVPAMLLVGSSATLSLDLAPLPLLWVLPLAIYLATFIAAFSERIPAPHPWVGRGACLIAVVLVFVTVTHGNDPVWLIALLHVLFLAGASWVAHRRLADDAPEPLRLEEFFTWIAFGGVLATVVSALLAPALLPDLWEYPVAIAIACAARPKTGVVVEDRPLKTDLPHVLACAGLVVASGLLVPYLGLENPQLVALATFGIASIYAYRWMPLRRRYTLCLIAIVLAGGLTHERGNRRLTRRSFFGVLRVVDQPGERHLLHGTTLHGSQRLSERDRCVPLAYYVEEGPLGAVFRAHRARGGYGRTLAIGLGTGAAACYARPGEAWRFVEINPDVAEVASDPQWFTYLANSPSDDVTVTLGDGRIGLFEEADRSLAILVVDAFNSDSVPVHLMTREALRLYVDKLEDGGWAVLHLSNRVLDLPKVLANVVAAEGLAARLADGEHGTYAVVARHEADLTELPAGRFTPLPAGEPDRAWTDSYSSLLGAIAEREEEEPPPEERERLSSR